MAKKKVSKPSLEKTFEWTSEILENRIKKSLVQAKEYLVEARGKATSDLLPGRWTRAKVKTWKKRIESLESQIKELKRGLGGVILTDPEHYKKTGLFKTIAERVKDPTSWFGDQTEQLANAIKAHGAKTTYTKNVSEFNPAGKVGHHRTALGTLRDAIEPLDVNVRSEFKRLALRDGYKVGEEFIDYIDPAAHKKLTKSISGAITDRLKYTHVDQIQAKDLRLFEAMAERSAHAAAFGGTHGLALPKSLIKEGANADEIYRLAKPYLELQRRGAEAGLQLDEILTSTRWNTSDELLNLIEKEMPLQDTTPILNKMRVDLMDADLMNPAGLRTPELVADRKATGMNYVSDRSRTRQTVDQIRANQWGLPEEVQANARIVAARADKAKAFGKIGKAATGLNKADAMVRFAAGDYVGGGVGLAMNTNAFRNALAKRLTKVAGKQFSGLVPGVGIGMSALDSAGYASQGRFTQAGIAALSGAVGEVPVIGDLFSGGLDLLNTGIDVATGNLVPDLTDPELGDPNLGGLRRAAKYAGQ